MPKSVRDVFQAVLQREPTTFEQSIYSALSIDFVANELAGWLEAANYVTPIIRLYQAAFGRVPDQDGLHYWTNCLRDGSATLEQIADGFVASREFQLAYGSDTVATPTLLTALYKNVLDRVPDDSGMQYWLHSGANASTLLEGFARSSEFISNTDSAARAFLAAAGSGTQDFSGSLFQADLLSLKLSSASFYTDHAFLAYDAIFSAPVSGFGPDDLIATVHSGSASAVIDSVYQSSISPGRYSFFATATGHGSISIDLKPNAGIHDEHGFAVALTGVSGQVIEV